MPYWQKYNRYDWQQSKTKYALPDKNTAPALAKSTRAVFSVYSCFKAYFRLLSPLPLYFTLAPFQARFAHSHADYNRHFWKFWRMASALCSLCSSVSCCVGFIFIHATGIWAYKLPSWFSATISHSSGRSAASFLMRLLYRPWQKVDLCQYFRQKKLKGYAAVLSSSSSFCS